MDDIELFTKARKRIAKEYRWCQNALHSELLWGLVKQDCALGALRVVSERMGQTGAQFDDSICGVHPYVQEFAQSISFESPWDDTRIPDINDDTDHKTVLAMFDYIIARLKTAKVLRELEAAVTEQLKQDVRQANHGTTEDVAACAQRPVEVVGDR